MGEVLQQYFQGRAVEDNSTVYADINRSGFNAIICLLSGLKQSTSFTMEIKIKIKKTVH